MITRRNVLFAMAAPAIVRVTSIMPVKSLPPALDIAAMRMQMDLEFMERMTQHIEDTFYYGTGATINLTGVRLYD